MIRRHPHKHVHLCLASEEKLWKRQLWYDESVTLVRPLVLSQFLHHWNSTGPAYADGNCLHVYISSFNHLYIALMFFFFKIFCSATSPCFRCVVPVFISKRWSLAYGRWVSQISGCQPGKERVLAVLMWRSVNLKQRVSPRRVCASPISWFPPPLWRILETRPGPADKDIRCVPPEATVSSPSKQGTFHEA